MKAAREAIRTTFLIEAKMSSEGIPSVRRLPKRHDWGKE